MKKFSKILAVVLTVCVLGGIIATSVLATDSAANPFVSDDQLKTTDNENTTYYDFDSDADGNTAHATGIFDSGSNAANTYSKAEVINAGNNKYLRWSWLSNTDAKGKENTKYYRRDLVVNDGDYEVNNLYYYSNNASNETYKQMWGTVGLAPTTTIDGHVHIDTSASEWTVSDKDADIKNAPPYLGLSNFDYVIFDFDVAADQYRYTVTTQADTDGDGNPENITEEILSDTMPEEGTYDAGSLRLAYSNDSQILVDNRSVIDLAVSAYPANSPDKKSVNIGYGVGNYSGASIYFRYDEEKDTWGVYAGAGSINYANRANATYTGYDLADTLGAWNHFTFVIKKVEEKNENLYSGRNLGNSELKIYFDGNLILETKIISSNNNNAEDIAIRGFDWSINEYLAKYSMAIDNVAVNFYENGYTSGAAYGIDDLLGENAGSKTLRDCEDVVYGKRYINPGEAYATIDGVNYPASYDFDGMDAATVINSQVKDGSEIVTPIPLNDFVIPESVESLTVVTDDPDNFSLSYESSLTYVTEYVEADKTYYVKRATKSDMLKYQWIYVDGDGNETLVGELSECVYSFRPELDTVIDGYRLNEEKNGFELVASSYSNWEFDIDGDYPEINLYDVEPVRALTALEAELIKEEFGGVVKYYSNEREQLATEVEDKTVLGSYNTELDLIVVASEFVSGTTVYTVESLSDYLPVSDVECFYIECYNESTFALSDNLNRTYFVYPATETAPITVRRITDDDYRTVIWVDDKGNEYKRDTLLLPGDASTPPDVDTTYYDLKEKTVYSFSWYCDLDGEGSEYSEKLVDAFNLVLPDTVTEFDKISTEIKIYPKLEAQTVDFVIYDEYARLYGDLEDFKDINNLLSAFENVTSDVTVELLYDVDKVFDIAEANTFRIPEGITVNFNLNGRTLVRSLNSQRNATYGIFTVTEDSTLNLYSSAPGAAIYEANYYSSYIEGTAGIVTVDENVNSCTVNIGDSTDNLACNGGTIVKVRKGLTESDDEKIKINIDGGSYYLALMPDNAMFSFNATDVEMTIENAALYNTFINISGTSGNYANAYGVFYDAANCTSDVKAYNCKFICMIEDDASGYTTTWLYHTFNEGSTAFFENCVIMGELGVITSGRSASSNTRFKGALKLGKGNQVFLGFEDKQSGARNYVYAVSQSMLQDTIIYEVKPCFPITDITVTKSITHSSLTKVVSASNMPTDANGYYYLNPAVCKSTVTLDRTMKLAVVTVNEDWTEESKPEYLEIIQWLDSDGETVIATDYDFAGATVAPYSLDGVTGKDTEESSWYDLAYTSWKNITEGAAAENSYVVVAGVANKFAPTRQENDEAIVADIDAKVNMTFYSYFSLNLYLPKEEGIALVGAYIDGDALDVTEATISYNGKELAVYCVTLTYDADSFSSYYVTVKFTAKGTELEETLVLNDIEYATRVAEAYGCGSEEAKLVYNFVTYRYGVYSYIAEADENVEPDADLTALVETFYKSIDAHGESCSCKTELESISALFSDEEKGIDEDSYAQLSGDGLVKGISYYLNISKPGIGIYVDSSASVTISVSYKDNNGETVNVASENIVKSETVYDGNKVLYNVQSIPAEYIGAVFTITVSVADSGEYTGQYCLAEYIERNGYDVAKMLYAYAYSCNSYAKNSGEKSPIVEY